MVADLLHGLRNRKLWFPCKYFTLNAASLTVIAVAMKLPMNQNNLIPGTGDTFAKIGSISFMSTMMSNLLPSLATMDTKELVSNIIALSILVITLVVNVCIQIHTGIVFNLLNDEVEFVERVIVVAGWVVPIFMLLDQDLQAGRLLSVEKLMRHVSNYWIMAGTGSPQFMIACTATTSASGVIFIMGTIAPIARCFATLSFKLLVKWIWKQVKVFKVESYWTQKLYDWKQSSIPLPSSFRKCKIVIQHLKNITLSICIGLQKTIVVTCKMIAMIRIFFVICVLCCLCCWKWLKAMFSNSHIVLKQKPKEQLGEDNDFSGYVLQLHDDIQFTERTLNRMLKSVNSLIQKAKKHQCKNLVKILAESRGFEGVEKFDSHHVRPLLSEEYLNCWSLTLVTLTSIAMSLPIIQNDMVDFLLSGVSEGLSYVTHVEQSLNVTDDHVSIQKAAEILWVEVECHRKWLGNKLPKPAPQLNTAGQTLQWLRDTAKCMVTKVESTDVGGQNDNSKWRSISANSMYHVTETILLSYHTNIDELSQEELFVQLSSMIANILAACLTNLPKVIAMKCHTRVIEKREASVQAAAQLLGETTQIINSLQDRELPRLDPDELAFIDKWRAYLNDPLP
ncbi:hypothetical protein L1887_01113 [Cichorium endivia]|nr:hypothetical protein L1887_01113 [Cichorium endivia]